MQAGGAGSDIHEALERSLGEPRRGLGDVAGQGAQIQSATSRPVRLITRRALSSNASLDGPRRGDPHTSGASFETPGVDALYTGPKA